MFIDTCIRSQNTVLVSYIKYPWNAVFTAIINEAVFFFVSIGAEGFKK